MSFGYANRVLSRFSKQSLHKTYQPRRCFSYSARLADQQQPQPDPPTSRTTHFGFENVPESEKASRVGKVFTSVAPSYDTMNDLMSLGIHRLWKDYFVRSLNPGVRASNGQVPSTAAPVRPTTTPTDHPSPSPSPSPPDLSMTILDVASGTGDIALRLLEHCSTIHGDTTSRVIISDINADMLRAGRKRIQTSAPPGLASRISYLEADAHGFATVPDGSIDLYTVAFGIRNFTDVPRALATAYRVLKPGGVFACLEFAPQLGNPVLNSLYKRWSFGAIPLIGQLVAGDRDSYQYLVESIERFPDQASFQGMIEGAGFMVPGGQQQVGGVMEEEGREKGWVDLTGGVAAIHKGVKPLDEAPKKSLSWYMAFQKAAMITDGSPENISNNEAKLSHLVNNSVSENDEPLF